MTVQFNLFGGTVLKLGTEKHHAGLLRGIDQMDAIGCFALTELGFGALVVVVGCWLVVVFSLAVACCCGGLVTLTERGPDDDAVAKSKNT
jgi:hypothetical protein